MSHAWLPEPADLVRMNPTPGSHRVAGRAAVSVLVPLAAVLALGHPHWAPYACFGAFTSLYGRNDTHLFRFQMQCSAAVTLTAAVVTGVLVACLPVPRLWQVLVAAMIAFTGQIIAKAHSYHPGGPLFLIFAFGGISAMPHTLDDVRPALLVCGASAAFSALVGVSGLLRHPSRIGQARRQAGVLRLNFVRTFQPLWMALAVLLAGGAAHLLQIGHPYWAMVSAVAPLSAPHVTSQVVRGVQRSVGTAVGLLPAALVLWLPLSRPGLVVVVALIQFFVEMMVGVNYALAMLLVTPLALAMGELGGPQPLGQVLFDRGVETAVGSVVGIAVALLGHHLRERRRPGHVPLR